MFQFTSSVKIFVLEKMLPTNGQKTYTILVKFKNHHERILD